MGENWFIKPKGTKLNLAPRGSSKLQGIFRGYQ